MVCELVGDEPGADGDGVLAGQGGVEQLGPGPLLVDGNIPARAQHPDLVGEEGTEQQQQHQPRHVTVGVRLPAVFAILFIINKYNSGREEQTNFILQSMKMSVDCGLTGVAKRGANSAFNSRASSTLGTAQKYVCTS